jgi:predicted RNA-binding protein with EMAP domain
MPMVAAGLAVLAGIAASDAICAARLGEIHRGDDHRGARALLTRATPDGKRLADALAKLLDVKDQAHYGVILVPPRTARSAVRWAQRLLDRAQEESER